MARGRPLTPSPLPVWFTQLALVFLTSRGGGSERTTSIRLKIRLASTQISARRCASHTSETRHVKTELFPRKRTITRELSWSEHVGVTTNKANKVLGVIMHTVGTVNQKVFSMLYMSLVRPILEYCVPVWSPYLVKAPEKIQHRASGLALRYDMLYEDRCKILNRPTLVKQTVFLSFIGCYKMVFCLNGLQFTDFIEFSKIKWTRANHDYKLYVIAALLKILLIHIVKSSVIWKSWVGFFVSVHVLLNTVD